jgi:hypothetical protein
MKRLLQIAAAGLLFVLVSCGPTQDQAISHNDVLVQDQKEILALEDNLINSIVDWEYQTAKNDLKIYQEKLSELEKKYNDMKAFDKEDEFRLAMINLIKALKEQADVNYAMVIEFIPLAPTIDELEDDPLYEMFEILDIIDAESDTANKKFLEAQETFAKKYDFTLQ